jgi:hypothetical protein
MTIFRKPTQALREEANLYERFGLRQNPFPTKPSVTVGGPDPRQNGSIYIEELRVDEQQRFEQLLIPKSERPQVRSIAFLMDYATRRGRGIGKTAFLYHQQKRIMSDLGNEMSGGTQVIFSTYVLPLPEGSYKKFWQFCKMLLEALTVDQNPIISLAIWRLRGFSKYISEEVLSRVGEVPEQTIGNNKWLQEQKVDVHFGLRQDIRSQLVDLNLSDVLINALLDHGHSPQEFRRHFFSALSDADWRKIGGKLVFDDLVKLFNLAKFTKGIFLIDEVEKIIQPQNTQERRSFTDSLRYYLVDGQCENARLTFYSFLFTIHPYVQEILTPHWEASGLDRFAALSRELASEYTVYLEPLNQNSAVPLAKAYLDASSINGVDDLRPFTVNALNEALIRTGRVPGRFLTLLNSVIERAIQENWETINDEQIQIVAQLKAPAEPDEQDIAEVLTPSLIKLNE